ncbi:insulinase family protein, partial [Clostridioides difficile]
MSLRHLRLAVLAVSLGFTFVSPWVHAATASAAATLPAGVTQGPSAEGISEYRFANGFKLLLLPDDSKPMVTVNITYLVGSRHENYGETGMAHLLEHLMFKGS